MWHRLVIIGILLLLVAGATTEARGEVKEPYRIGPEDVLSITFVSRSDLRGLDQPSARVTHDGTVVLPYIQSESVAGLTVEEASRQIYSRMVRYVPSLEHVTVQVVAYHSRRVLVTGDVVSPGHYAYEVVPDVWTVIKDAGGRLETGDLSQVTVVTPSGRQTVNLARIIADGMTDTLPPLPPGSTVSVPGSAYATSMLEAFQADAKPVVHVTGEVARAGTFQLSPGLSLYDAISLAGGFGPNANAKKVTVISQSPGGPVSQPVDLRPDTKDRTGMAYEVQYEDLIIVGQKGPSWSSVVRDVAAAAAIVTSIIVILDYIDRSNQETNGVAR